MKIAMHVFQTLVQLEHRTYCMTYIQMIAYTECVSRQCFLAIQCGFVSDLVVNSEDWFSDDTAQIIP